MPKFLIFFGLVMIVIKGVIFFFFLFLVPTESFAITGHLIISEIYYNVDHEHGADPANEWVELYNSSSSNINLKKWQIRDNNISRTISQTDLIVESNTFVLISKSAETWSYWGLTGNNLPQNLVLVALGDFLGNGLSNNGDLLKLIDANGVVVDELSWGSNKTIFNLAAVSKGRSLLRADPSNDTNSSFDFINCPLPNPGRNYIRPIYSSSIAISEILPRPSDGSGREFIELFNSSDQTVDISGWEIDDDIGGSQPYRLPAGTNIASRNYRVIRREQSSIFLNDSGDKARLIDPSGEIRSSIAFEKSSKGMSFSQFEGGWDWTKSSTPGYDNILVMHQGSEDERDLETYSINLAKSLNEGGMVRVSGKTLMPCGKLGKDSLYIQDWSGSIQLFFIEGCPANIFENESIEVWGLLSSFNGEKRLKVENVLVIDDQDDGVPGVVSHKGDILEENESEYIEVFGKVVEKEADKVFISSAGSEIEVVFRQIPELENIKLKLGDGVLVKGIVSEYRGRFRLLPFRAEDVKIIESLKDGPEGDIVLPKTGNNEKTIFFLTLGVTGLWNILVVTLKKLTELPSKS